MTFWFLRCPNLVIFGPRFVWSFFTVKHLEVENRSWKSWTMNEDSYFRNIKWRKYEHPRKLTAGGPKRMGWKTGYVCRPELQHTKETIFLVNAFLSDCYNNQNYNLPMQVSTYFRTPPVPTCKTLTESAMVITPEQVIYKRNLLYKRRRAGN